MAAAWYVPTADGAAGNAIAKEVKISVTPTPIQSRPTPKDIFINHVIKTCYFLRLLWFNNKPSGYCK